MGMTSCDRARQAHRSQLPGRDPAASLKFYTEVLGLKVVMDQGWILTFAAPRNPTAQLSVMQQDASASLHPTPRSRSTTWTRRMPQLGAWAMRSSIR
jgi:catechol 2,3-dioxygenase-like lactoylglutathione lyase family enzyme